MNNSQIIFQESLELMKLGIIGSTGKTMILEDEDGTTRTVPEPEPIHTYRGWKSLGYQVRKGEKACTSFNIWKHKDAFKRQDKESGDEIEVSEKLFLTNAFFFRKDQCEPIESQEVTR